MSGVNLLLPTELQPGQVSPDRAAFLHMHLVGETMGTNWSATWFALPGLDPEDIRKEFEALFERTILSMSPWESASLISSFNALPAGAELQVDTAFEEVLRAGLRLARLTDGAFDPCLGGAVMRNGFGAAGIGTGTLGTAHGPDVWDRLFGRPEHIRQPGGVTLDLSAIAKGYAVDRMADILEARGVSQYLIEIGGEFVASGVKPDRSPWWLDLETRTETEAPWRLALIDGALATSGDYRQFAIRQGKRISHIVSDDARQTIHGDLASVSVIAGNCMDADGWATALFACGDQRGLNLADTHGIKAIFQYRNAPARLSAPLTPMADRAS